MKLLSGCTTDRGNYREKNQDRAVCHKVKKKKDRMAVACVCDGIGSFPYSEIASEMVTSGISRWFQGMEVLFPDLLDEESIVEDLETTIQELNELVYQYRKEGEHEIGCTMSALLLINQNYYIFHAGDSRIYRFDETISQITKDEISVVEKEGKIRSLLANYIGKSPELWMNKTEGNLKERTVFLLGTDGLFKRMIAEDIRLLQNEFRNDKGVEKVCLKLVKNVLERGERDNVSCIVIAAEQI